MGLSLSKRALALAGSFCALSMSSHALAQDAPDTLTRLVNMGFPIDSNGDIADSAVIELSNGYLLSIFDTGAFTIVDENSDDVLSGSFWTALGDDDTVLMGISNANGTLAMTFYSRESVDTDVMFESTLTRNSSTFEVNPGLLSGIDIPSVNVGECACWTVLPPICPTCPPRSYGGPGCTRRDCDLQNPCAFTVPAPQGSPPARTTLPAAVAILAGSVGGGGMNLMQGGGQPQPAPPAQPAGTTYQGTCEGGSEHIALAFLAATILGLGLARRRVLAP